MDMKKEKFLVVDLEATCQENDRIYGNETIEIGAVMVASNGDIIGEFNEFVRPIKKPILTDFCRNLTSIQQSDVDNADCFPTVWERFCNWINGIDNNAVFASWGYYDANQLRNDCNLHNLSYDYPWFNRHISLKHQYSEITGNKKNGMAKALRHLKIPFVGTHHRGIDDARNTVKILIHEKLFSKWLSREEIIASKKQLEEKHFED